MAGEGYIKKGIHICHSMVFYRQADELKQMDARYKLSLPFDKGKEYTDTKGETSNV